MHDPRRRRHAQRLSTDALNGMFDRLRAGDHEMAAQIALANLGLVDTVASLCEQLANSHYLAYDDIWQQGVLGLYTAIKNFDYSKAKFSTYAWRAIYHSITKYIYANTWSIDTEAHRRGVHLLAQIKAELRRTYDRDPTLSEISQFGNISVRQAIFYGMPKIRLVRYDQAVYDISGQNVEEEFEETQLLSDLHRALVTLKTEHSPEYQTAEMYYGLGERDTPVSKTATGVALHMAPRTVLKRVDSFLDRLAAAIDQ